MKRRSISGRNAVPIATHIGERRWEGAGVCGDWPKRVFEKFHARAIRFSIRRIAARSIIVSEVCTRYS